MSSNTLLLFGDQTGEILPFLQKLWRLRTRFENLDRFFCRSTERLRTVISRTSTHHRRRWPSFNTILELANAAETRCNSDAALRAALLCVSQIGHMIVHLELHPRALDGLTSEPTIVGICTGLVTAAAVSCCRSLADVLSVGDEVVQLAFQVGLEASRRSENIECSEGSWATLVSNVDPERVRRAIDDFNEDTVLEYSRKAYISAESGSSLTISGPPSTTTTLFASSALFQHCKKAPLSVSAAFHANHLEPVLQERIFNDLSANLLERAVQHPAIIAPSSGQPVEGTTLAEILVGVLCDNLQLPILWEALTQGLSRRLAPETTGVSFGPVNSAKAIQQSLQTKGIQVRQTDQTIPSESLSQRNGGAIAIVGMAARLPGSESLEEFWKVLEEGRDLHEKIRPDRFDVNTHCDPSGQIRNTTLTPYGVFIDRPGYFDTRLFNMSPREAAQTDPQQRLMLLTTYEALEMAGYAPDRTPSSDVRRIGSFIGQTSDDWREVNASQNVDTYFITGGIRAFGPGRLNYHFGWEGPSYSVDTACSSSAASIQLACSALLARECDTAVGGGANFLTASDLFAGLSRGSFLSKTGGCKTFDQDADGYVRADAVGVVVLKRLDDALADRDNVLAVLRAAVTNHSAEAVSITHPHAGTQARLFNAALDQAGLDPHEIDYAELHGTDTQAGDVIESTSVTNVLACGRTSANPLYMGTVKPNLGHGEAASGVTSLIKAIMMLRKNMIPPHVGIKGRINQKLPPFAELNTHISFGKTPFLARPDGDGKRRILINNFDAAGGNTSMIIEDPPVALVEGTDPRTHHVVVISGKTSKAMLDNTKRLLTHVKEHRKTRLEDVAYTTAARRMHHVLRTAHAVSSVDALVLSLEKTLAEEAKVKAPSSPPSAVFVFTGQGSQYASMASELFRTQPTFRESIEDHLKICASHGFQSFLPLITDRTMDMARATPVQIQLAIVSVELALAALWKSFGVTPTAVVGHSLGEYAALCTAGVVSVSECLYLVGKRASLMLSNCTPGTHSMLAIPRSAEEVGALIREFFILEFEGCKCEIACINGPVSTVVSGPAEQIKHFQRLLQSRAIKTTILEVQFAFHSAQMNEVLGAFAAVTKKVHFSSPKIPIASTLLGSTVTTSGVIDAEYLTRQTREPVQFVQALHALKSTACLNEKVAWIETGPSPVCLSLIRSAFDEGETLLPSLKRNERDWKVLASSVSEAYNLGFDIDWKEYHRPFEQALRLLELPRYAFELKNHWIQYKGDWAIRKGDASPGRDAAGGETPSFSTTTLHKIESRVSDATGASVTFVSNASEPKLNHALRGHLVNGAGLCPSSVYADMAFTAARFLQKSSSSSHDLAMDVRDMVVHKPLLIQPGATRQLIRVTAKKLASSSTVEVSFGSQDGGVKEDHAHCTVFFGDGNDWKSEWARNAYLIKARMEHLVSSASSGETHKILRSMVYKLFAALVDYDAKYQGLREVYMDSKLLEAAANVKFNTTDADGSFTYSPYWIDSLAHLSGFVLNGADTTSPDSVYISHGWGSMKIVGQLSADRAYQSYVRMQETKTRGVMAGDVYFFEDGEVVAVCQNLKFQRIKRTILNHLLPPTGTADDVPSSHGTALSQLSKQRAIEATRPRMPLQQEVVQAIAAPNFDNVLKVVAAEIEVEPSELSDDALFADLGVDSLLSISIAAKLGRLLDQDVPVTVFSECHTVAQLRTYFAEHSPGSPSISDDSSSNDDVFSDKESGPATPYSDVSPPPDPASGAPSTEMIRRIIADEVGVDVHEIEAETPLADLGVDSLLSLSILSTLKSQTGKALPSSFLVENPTLAAVQAVLCGATSRSTPAPLHKVASALERVQKKTSTRKAEAVWLQGSSIAREPCLFLLPDGSGSAGSYVGLPPIKIRGAVYGLNSPFVSAAQEFTVSLPDMAAMFLREIRRVQPHGPYHLAGWSIGGAYAFEVASQLIQQHGEKVDSLILIDAPCPATLPPLPVETIDLLETTGVFDNRRDESTPQASRQTKLRPGTRDHFLGSINALKQYRPLPLPRSCVAPKKVAALWARQGVLETVTEEARSRLDRNKRGGNVASDWMLDPRASHGTNGWETLLPESKIDCMVVAGNHFTMMKKPGVVELGERLNDLLGG